MAREAGEHLAGNAQSGRAFGWRKNHPAIPSYTSIMHHYIHPHKTLGKSDRPCKMMHFFGGFIYGFFWGRLRVAVGSLPPNCCNAFPLMFPQISQLNVQLVGFLIAMPYPLQCHIIPHYLI